MGETTDLGMALFAPLIRDWFKARFGAPTDIQRLVWPAIAAGEHLLIVAPTGSGKTLAAFLWAIQRLASGDLSGGTVRVLYVSPLKALNNDVARNLLQPLGELRDRFAVAGTELPLIRVLTRSGDTPESERRRMGREPPEILITTPESLNLLLLSKRGRAMLDSVATVILDEIHAVADSKRGVYLMTAVERLSRLSGDIQRVALSATVRPVELVAEMVGGWIQTGPERFTPRPVRIVRAEDDKRLRVTVACPAGIRDRLVDGSRYPALIADIRGRLAKNRSTLLFTNNRKRTEKIARLLNDDWDPPQVYSHHGSLSREVRHLVEERFKAGQLKGIVATSSLELGIDIGDLDEVILVDAPRTLSSGVQRVGRAGHGVGAVSCGVIYPTHEHAFVDAAAMAPLIAAKRCEEVRPVRNALDVLAQVIVASCVNETWRLDDLYDFLRTSWAYHDLRRNEYELVLEMLAGRYAETFIRELSPRVRIDRISGTISARDGARHLLARAGGVIPDRGYFNIRVQPSGALVGQLDEEFVWERRVGDRFSFGAQAWRIEKIGHNDVEVTGAKHAVMPPFWRGEALDRDFELCEQIGLFLADAGEGLDDPEFHRRLRDRHGLDEPATEELRRHLRRQKEATGAELPHRYHVLVEHFSDPANAADQKQVILHAPWGGRILRPLAICLQAAFDQRYGLTLELMANDEGIALSLPHAFGSDELLELVPPDRVESLLRRKLEATGFFGARFRESAACALLLPRQHPTKRLPLWLNRLRAKKLMQAVARFKDFPILLETWRTCLEDYFDLAGLGARLAEVADGRIRVSEVKTTTPSPFAADLVWRGTDRYMYQDDTPQSSGPSRLDEGLLTGLLASSSMRPRLAVGLVAQLTAKLQRTCPDYSPADAGELYDLLAERAIIPLAEWHELEVAMARDHQSAEHVATELGGRVGRVTLPGAAGKAVVALERIPGLLAALELSVEELHLRGLEGEALTAAATEGLARLLVERHQPEDETGVEGRLDALVEEVLRFYGPVALPRVGEILGGPPPRLTASIARLVEDGSLVCDLLTEGATATELCDAENLERLLRMGRAAQRPGFVPLAIEALPLFVASLHEMTGRGATVEDLQQGLERLFGHVAPAALWETEILPARLASYQSSSLDSSLQQSDLIWFGAGAERLGFCFEDWLDLFAETVAESESAPDAGEGSPPLLPNPTGRFSLQDLRQHTGLATAELVGAIWQEVWAGRLSNDTFASIRSGLASGFEPPLLRRPPRRRRGSWRPKEPLVGAWFALPRAPARDALEEEEANRDRVRQLFARYGVLFRERLAHEAPAMGWRSLLKTLRLMEFSGEALAGHYFSGINGLQFVDPAALRRLRAELPEEAVYWLNAADPISLCGCAIEALKGDLPPRIPTTHLVYRGRELAMVSKRHGRHLEIRLPADHDALPEVLRFFNELLARRVNPLKVIAVEEINGEEAVKSPYAPVLGGVGFAREIKALVLSRRY